MLRSVETDQLGSPPTMQMNKQQGQDTRTSRTESHTPTICVTGALGATAQSVIEHLVNSNQDVEIIAGVHDASALGQTSRGLLSQHCHDIISLDKKAGVDLSGIDILMLVPPSSKNRVQEVKALVEAAKQGGVKFILLLSIIGSDSMTNAMTRQFSMCEEAVKKSGIDCSFLRTNFYMENVLFQGRQLAQNQIMLPIRNGKLNLIAMDDVGHALSVMLLDTGKFSGKSFELNGREALSGNDIARHISTILGRQVTFHPCSQEEYVELLTQEHVPGWLAQAMASFLGSFEHNRDIEQIQTVEFFKDLTGNKPIRFFNWLEGALDTLNASIRKHEQSSSMHGNDMQGGRLQEHNDQPDYGRRTGDSQRRNGQRLGGMQGSGMRSQTASQFNSDVSMDEMKHIIHQLIAERNAFTRDQKDVINTNEEHLARLHQLEKRMQKMGSGDSQKNQGGRQHTTPRRDQTVMGQFEYGVPLRSDIVILEFDD